MLLQNFALLPTKALPNADNSVRMIQDEPSNTSAKASNAVAGCRIALKVVPGSRKDEIVGRYGELLKVKVAAPPEDGKANAAVCALLARTLRVGVRQVVVISGVTNPEKVVHVVGVNAVEARARLGVD